LVSLRAEFSLDALQTELVTTILLWGCALGAALAGFLSDRYGRRAVLLAAGTLFCFSALGSAFSATLWQLFVARAAGGVAIGSASMIAPLYIAEIAPARLRGRLVTVNQLAMVVGILVAFISNYALAGIAHGAWRWMFGLGALPAAVFCLLLLWIPESPRWLLQRGLRDQARAVRLQFSSAEDVEGELAEMDRAIGEESGSYRELFGRALRKPMTLAILLAIIQQATGINTVLYYGSIVFSEHVGASASGAMGMNIMVGVVNLLFTIAAFFGIDRLGRKPLLLIATAGMGACLTAFSLLLIFHSGNALLLLLPILGYVAFFAFGLGSGVWVCMAELLPNRVRGRAMSVATTVLWIAVSVVAATFLSLIRIFSAPAVFLGYAVICALSYLYIQFNLPETKNRTLEEIARLWQQNRD